MNNFLQQMPAPEQMVQGMETKMTIVLNTGSKASRGDQAVAISKAVIKAYESCEDRVSVMQWELNSWPKICLKAKSHTELE